MEMKRVPLNDLHEKWGAKMVPFAGYNMPVRYSSDIEEHMAVRKSVGVFDVSHMGEFTVKGPHALDLIQRVTSNDASKLVSSIPTSPKYSTRQVDSTHRFKTETERLLPCMNITTNLMTGRQNYSVSFCSSL